MPGAAQEVFVDPGLRRFFDLCLLGAHEGVPVGPHPAPRVHRHCSKGPSQACSESAQSMDLRGKGPHVATTQGQFSSFSTAGSRAPGAPGGPAPRVCRHSAKGAPRGCLESPPCLDPRGKSLQVASLQGQLSHVSRRRVQGPQALSGEPKGHVLEPSAALKPLLR